MKIEFEGCAYEITLKGEAASVRREDGKTWAEKDPFFLALCREIERLREQATEKTKYEMLNDISVEIVEAATLTARIWAKEASGKELSEEEELMLATGEERRQWIMKIMEPVIKSFVTVQKVEAENSKLVLQSFKQGKLGADDAMKIIQMLKGKAELEQVENDIELQNKIRGMV
jgi:polyhydroxyalkanoate synthesis regulator phasin